MTGRKLVAVLLGTAGIAAGGQGQESPPALGPVAPEVFPFVARPVGTDAWLRAGPNENFPPIRLLREDDLVIVHGRQVDWYEVEVPAGFPAFVAQRYARDLEPGWVETTEPRVNLRAVPTSRGNLPLRTLPEAGTKMRSLGEEEGGAWVRVLAPADLHVFVHASRVTRTGTMESMATVLEALRESSLDVWKARRDARVADQERVAREAQLRQRFQATETEYQVQMAKPEGEEDFKDLLAVYKDLLAQTEDEALRGEVEERVRILEGRIAYETGLARVREEAAQLPAELDRIEREHAEKLAAVREKIARKQEHRGSPVAALYPYFGWVEGVVPFVGRPTRYRLVQGGVPLVWIESPDGRFTLGDFQNQLVGVAGTSVASPTGLETIQIEKLEIF